MGYYDYKDRHDRNRERYQNDVTGTYKLTLQVLGYKYIV